MNMIKSPNEYTTRNKFSIFLAGSIEMGMAVDWQQSIADALYDIDGVQLLNPRRDDWDSSWAQTIENPQFAEQVRWELTALEKSDLIIYYFAPGTQSPISLLELGLYANHTKNIWVCCPEGFWRKGNIEIVCQRYMIPFFDDFDHMVDDLRYYLPIWTEDDYEQLT